MRKATKKTAKKQPRKQKLVGITEMQLDNLLKFFEVCMDYDSYRKKIRDIRDRFTEAYLIAQDTDPDFNLRFQGLTMRDDLIYLDLIITNEDNKPLIQGERSEKLKDLLVEARSLFAGPSRAS